MCAAPNVLYFAKRSWAGLAYFKDEGRDRGSSSGTYAKAEEEARRGCPLLRRYNESSAGGKNVTVDEMRERQGLLEEAA